MVPTNTWAVRRNTTLPSEGTAEEQFAAVEANTRQRILNNIRGQQQPTAPDQSPDVSSSSLEDKAAPKEEEPTVTTSGSSFELIHYDDNEQEVRVVPPVPYKHLTAPITPQEIQDIWDETFSEDEEGDITTVSKGTSNLTVQAQIHNNRHKNIKSAIETDDSAEDDDADDEAEEEDIQFLRQLTECCESVENTNCYKWFSQLCRTNSCLNS